MTPQLQQAIKLLALSNLEIEAFIAEEVEKNPLLSADGADASDVSDAPVTSDPFGPAGDGSTAEPTDPPMDLDYATESHQQDSVADGGFGLDGALGLRARGSCAGHQVTGPSAACAPARPRAGSAGA